MRRAMPRPSYYSGADDDDAGHHRRGGGGAARPKELAVSCMLNTEAGAVIAVIRRPPLDAFGGAAAAQVLSASPEDSNSGRLLFSLKSLRAIIFHPLRGEWRTTNPSVYLAPFLDVIQSDDVPAAATALALSAVLKILKLGVFDERTPGARDAIHSIVFALTNCRLERTDPSSEDAVLMRVLHVLVAIIHARTSVLLTDHAVCTVVNTCFQVVQQSLQRGELLQRNTRHSMNELIQAIFTRLPEVSGNSGTPDAADDDVHASGYGARCMIDIFNFLCSMLSLRETPESSGDDFGLAHADEEVQLFALTLINSAVELGGESIGKHPKLLQLVQDDLFYHLVHFGTRSNPLLLSMICSTVLNLYQFLRRCLRLQLEAFFTYVLLKVASGQNGVHVQEVAIEAIVSFCRLPSFAMEAYVNYDCDPMRHNVFEDVGKLLCKTAFPVGNPATPMQVQAFEGLVSVITTIADNIEVTRAPNRDAYNIDDSEYKPFWSERCDNYENPDTWVEFVRMRKLKKKKIMIAANHYNRDEKKGLTYLNVSHVVPTPPEAKSLAYFFRYTRGLDKVKIGDYLGDPSEFNINVLKEFTETFDFSGVILDTALRCYLETFRLPGESQKIQRILEAFSDRFYEHQTNGVFVNKDAVLVLCYSVIMLNTDQHNPQVKKKMTEEEFIRNNRSINGGADLPREFLSELFQSISTNAITLFESAGLPTDLNATQWNDLIKRSRVVEPFIVCDYKHKLSREAFITISGPSVATLSAIFEQTDDEDTLPECVEGLISIARIARYGLEDVLDELLSCFCKFTTLLNPYATAEETLFTFSHEIKPRMATVALFTVANRFGESVRGAWRNLVDCLLKIKRLKLLPLSVIDPESSSASEYEAPAKSDSGIIFPSSHNGGGGGGGGGGRSLSGLIGHFSQLVSNDGGADSMLNAGSEFENNLKLIQQCQIGNIFKESSKLPDESLQNLGRALIFAAAGKGQKFSTPVEEEETVGFCLDLLIMITMANLQRFGAFWAQFHDCFTVVSQLPLFSPSPFAEKAIVGLFKIAVRLFATPSSQMDKLPEELIFKSINLMWKLDKEILDTCCRCIADSIAQILNDRAASIQTMLGWKTVFHLLSVSGRHPETFDQAVEALIKMMSEGTYVTRYNYAYCIEAAFNFSALKISPVEKSSKILDLMADSVSWLVQWHKSGFSDPGSGGGMPSSMDEGQKMAPGNISANLFVKLVDALRKISLVRREEIRNQAVAQLRKCFAAAEELELTPASCLGCFNLVIFAMVDDLHEKMLEYSRRENSEREMRSMEGTLKAAMELLVDVYAQYMVPLSQSPGFRTFWLGVLRRMDTCMKANLGDDVGVLHDMVPELLKRIILQMKDKGVLVQREGDELWEITNIQIQWIAPAVKEELFPDDF